ncbi:MAG: hypothetical protein WBP13_02540 [Methylophilaceae bacterium]
MTDLENLHKKTFNKPYSTVLFQGHEFQVLDIHEAHRIVGELKDLKNNLLYNVYEDSWRFPVHEENAFFLYIDKEVTLEILELIYSVDDYPDLFILGIIFVKSLVVEKYIQAADTDNSPALIALSNVTARNIYLYGNVHYVGGNMTCEVVWGEYNHGELYVKGNLTATYAYADDMDMYFYCVDGLYAHSGDTIYTLLPVSNEEGDVLWLTSLPNASSPNDFLKDDFEHGQLLADSMLDLSKRPIYTKEMLDKAFEAVFARFKAETLKENPLRIFYQALPMVTNEVSYQYIFKTQAHGLTYRIGAWRDALEGAYQLMVEFYTDETLSQLEYYFQMPFDENTLMNRIAKHHIFEAVNVLLNE